MYILYNRCRVIILYIIESPGLCRNYITNFGDFISPFPNYFNLGSDVRYLERNGVRGLFQEGSYVGPGGDMDELKNYLLGRDESRDVMGWPNIPQLTNPPCLIAVLFIQVS